MRVWPFGTLGRRGHPTWEQRLSGRTGGASEGDALESARDSLAAALHDNLLPFWTERLPRAAPADGVFLAEQRDGRRVINLILLTRYLWFVSTLAASAYRRDLHVELADQSYRWLCEWLHDRERAGFYWEVDLATGVPHKAHKHAYGQAFAICALSQYGEATGNAEAVALAKSTFASLESHAHDATHGGYREWFERDWQPAPDEGYLGWDGRCKLVNTHLHLLEAFTALQRVAPDALLESRIAELIEILSVRVVSPRYHVAVDCHHESWTPLRRRRNDRVSFGHEVEAIYLLAQACDTIGIPRDSLLAHYRRRFAYCMRFGFDYEQGGFFDWGPVGRSATATTKIWWVQAEGLLTALALFRLTRERPYLAVFERTLGWIVGTQIDWQGGEWHRNVDPHGRPAGIKVDRWKCPYHNGRALLVSLSMIDELL